MKTFRIELEEKDVIRLIHVLKLDLESLEDYAYHIDYNMVKEDIRAVKNTLYQLKELRLSYREDKKEASIHSLRP